MKINLRQVYIDRIFEIDNQFRKMRKLGKWTGYKELKEERIQLKLKINELELKEIEKHRKAL
ncbi:hypothetical protein [Clostridium perfringens]|uniref:hypothetical protein n=1 Tax=Clostridium perfringens TaxID=1502 RepID=UPI001C850159|nr:hypothetical protein [Clostridium perfringens]EJT6169395.1 hypothetical protein [Clostridium perfringens]EJT6622467.1 hypothetical protein [Clostridium perfringens]